MEFVSSAIKHEVSVRATEVDRERAFPLASVTALAEAGAFGLLIPTGRGAARLGAQRWPHGKRSDVRVGAAMRGREAPYTSSR